MLQNEKISSSPFLSFFFLQIGATETSQHEKSNRTTVENVHVNMEEANIYQVIEILKVNAAMCFLDNDEHPVQRKEPWNVGLFNEIVGPVYTTKVTQ